MLLFAQVTPEYLQNICVRLFAPSNGESVDISKPGTVTFNFLLQLVYDYSVALTSIFCMVSVLCRFLVKLVFLFRNSIFYGN